MATEYSTPIALLAQKNYTPPTEPDTIPVIAPSVITQPIPTQEPRPSEFNEKHYLELLKKENTTMIDRLKTLNKAENFKDVIIIGILFILFSSRIYINKIKELIPYLITPDNELGNIGLLITTLLFSFCFVLLRMFT